MRIIGVLLAFAIVFQVSGLAAEKQRIIVLTDITNEPDDEESMVRFLVYANEYDVEGLIATTSVWLRDKVVPEKIRERVEAYGKVHSNLSKHAEGFPTAGSLRDVIKSGRPEFGMKGVGPGKSSEGSRHIISVVDRPDPRPVWVTAWGGANCLAQALWEVKNTRGQEELDAFVAKLRVYTISDQDDSGKWMRDTFPNLSFVVTPSAVGGHEYYRATWTGISGDKHYRNGPGHQWKLVSNEWLEENVIKNHGPLGALYPKWAYIMEGDTPSYLWLINNGLGSHISPAYGGWGGRYVLFQSYGEARPIWTNVADARDTVTADDGQTYTSAQATIWRWREAYQNDFAARMDWCVMSMRERANHNPLVVVNGDQTKDVIELEITKGDTVTLDAGGTKDPDGDAISYRWFHYAEVDGYRVKKEIELTGADSSEARVKLVEAPKGREIHLILEVKDDGAPALFAYRRVILKVK
jgi:cellulose-binding protein